ncbi:CAP domain-containing protein [Marimonas lutisalis]|uniref:CAP domain-containing protein n=1 Tax=Marimonas lutisalis TaxID=2545756 RepID=UPI001F326E2B|nr:CAP domain-containing protein [Marimonas lutisalis]
MRMLLALLLMMAAMAARAEPVREVVQMTNAYRAQAGLPPLAVSPVLEAVAEGHGRDMVRKGFFAHRGSDGSTVARRAQRRGYRFCVIAENIAQGQKSPRAVMQSWIGSAGHRRNLLNRKVSEIGVIRTGGDTWVMVLGNPDRRC